MSDLTKLTIAETRDGLKNVTLPQRRLFLPILRRWRAIVNIMLMCWKRRK